MLWHPYMQIVVCHIGLDINKKRGSMNDFLISNINSQTLYEENIDFLRRIGKFLPNIAFVYNFLTIHTPNSHYRFKALQSKSFEYKACKCLNYFQLSNSHRCEFLCVHASEIYLVNIFHFTHRLVVFSATMMIVFLTFKL